MRLGPRAAAFAATLLIAALATACDDGRNLDEAAAALDREPIASEADILAITELASTVIAGRTPGHICNVLLEDSMVEEFYRTVPACRRLVAAPADDTAAVAVVDAVDVDGARGTATVTAQGGPADGATGTWNFVRTPQGWRVEGWSVEYLRSVMLALFGPRYQPKDADDPLGSQPVRVCVNGQFQDKDDTGFLAAAKTYLRGGKPAEKLLAEAVAACSDAGKG